MNKIMREIHARVWAKKMYDCNNLICDLQKGQRFSFPNSNTVYTYSGRGWYKNNKKSFKTGMFTACTIV